MCGCAVLRSGGYAVIVRVRVRVKVAIARIARIAGIADIDRITFGTKTENS